MKRGTKTPFRGGSAYSGSSALADWFLDQVHFTGPWCPNSPRFPSWPDLTLSAPGHQVESKDFGVSFWD